MPLSSTKSPQGSWASRSPRLTRPARLLAAASVTVLATGLVHAQIGTAGPGRLVDIVEVNDHDEQVDISVQFNCSVRYVTHLPASEGAEIRVQLQPFPDCRIAPGAPVASEIPPISGGGGIVAAV